MYNFFRKKRKGAILSFEQAAYLLVIVILVGIGTIGWREWTDYSRRDVATHDVAKIANAVSQYHFEHDAYPNDLNDLTKKVSGYGPYLPDVKKDPWGIDYKYTIDGDYFIIYTFANSSGSEDGDSKMPSVTKAQDSKSKSSTIYIISQ